MSWADRDNLRWRSCIASTAGCGRSSRRSPASSGSASSVRAGERNELGSCRSGKGKLGRREPKVSFKWYSVVEFSFGKGCRILREHQDYLLFFIVKDSYLHQLGRGEVIVKAWVRLDRGDLSSYYQVGSKRKLTKASVKQGRKSFENTERSHHKFLLRPEPLFWALKTFTMAKKRKMGEFSDLLVHLNKLGLAEGLGLELGQVFI